MWNSKSLHTQSKKSKKCEILTVAHSIQKEQTKSEILNPCELDPKRAKNVKF